MKAYFITNIFYNLSVKVKSESTTFLPAPQNLENPGKLFHKVSLLATDFPITKKVNPTILKSSQATQEEFLHLFVMFVTWSSLSSLTNHAKHLNFEYFIIHHQKSKPWRRPTNSSSTRKFPSLSERPNIYWYSFTFYKIAPASSPILYLGCFNVLFGPLLPLCCWKRWYRMSTRINLRMIVNITPCRRGIHKLSWSCCWCSCELISQFMVLPSEKVNILHQSKVLSWQFGLLFNCGNVLEIHRVTLLLYDCWSPMCCICGCMIM